MLKLKGIDWIFGHDHISIGVVELCMYGLLSVDCQSFLRALLKKANTSIDKIGLKLTKSLLTLCDM